MAERKPASTQRQVTIHYSRGVFFALELELDQDIGSIPPEKYGEETSRLISKELKKLRDNTELYVDEFDFCVWNPEKDRYQRIKQEDILPNVLKGREVCWQNLKAHGSWYYGEWRAESEDDSCSVEGDVSQWIEFDDLEQEEESAFLTSHELTREAARIIYLYSARYKESATDFFWSRLIPWSKYDRPRALSVLEEHVFMVCHLKVERELKRLVRRYGIEDMYKTVLELGWENLDRYSDEWVAYHWQFDFGEKLIEKIDERLSASCKGYGYLDANMIENYVQWLRELMDDKEFWKIEPLSESSYSLWEEEDAVVSKRLDDGERGTGRKGLQHAKQGKVRKDDENKLPRAKLHVQKEISRSGRKRKMTEKMAALAKNGCLA